MDGGWWIVMMLGMVLFGAMVIAFIVWLVRGGAQSLGARARVEPTSLDILERRFAEGAISAEEYKERREVLRGSPS